MVDFNAGYDPYSTDGQRPEIGPMPFMALPSIAPPQRNALVAGVSSGIDDLGGLAGRAVQGVGKLTGWDGLESAGQRFAKYEEAKSQANGRADLDTAPWREGGGGWGAALPWLGYQAGKQIPQLAATIGAAALVPEAVVPAGLAKLAAFLPEAITGSEAGLTAAGIAAKNAHYAKDFGKLAIGGLPESFGSLYQQAAQREEEGGEKATRGDALQALGLSPFYSALDAAEPAFLKGLAQRGSTGNFLKRVATGGAAGALQEIPTEALQTAMENSFRPDMTPQQKMDNIVDAALTGGAVGGLFGGVASMRRAKSVAPKDLTNENITDLVDQATNPEKGGLPAVQGGRDVAARSTPPAPGSNQVEGPGLAGLLGYDPIKTNFTATADGRVTDNPANLSPLAQPGLQVEPQVPGLGTTDFVAGADGTVNAPQNATPPVPVGERRTVFSTPDMQPAVGAEQRPALAAPAAAPKGIDELFAGQSNEQITAQRAQLESDIAARNGRSTQDQMKALRLLRAEEERRASGGEAQRPSQGGLFAENDFDQRMPRRDQQAAPKAAPEPVEAKPDPKPMQELARSIVGRKVQWMTKIDATDEVGLASHVQDRLESGASDDATFKLAEKFGLVDNKNQPLDMAAALAKAQATVARAQAAIITDPTATDRLDMAQSKLQDLQQKAKILQDVQQRRAGGEVEQQPQQEKSAGAAPQTMQQSLEMSFGPQVMAADASGNVQPQAAPVAAPKTAPETRAALQPVVGTMTPDLKNLNARSLPEAVNAVEDHFATNPKPTQTFVKLAQNFGLWENGKPVSVADAIDKLQTQRAAVQQKIDALTPQQAPRSRGLAVEAGAIQQQLDVLLQSRDSRADVAQRNKSAAISAVQEKTGLTDEAKGLLPARRAQLLSIARDKSLPGGLRRDATVGLGKIQNQTGDALEHADNVVAKYAAATGDLTAQRANPDFAQQKAAEMNGQVVQQTADGALIRGFDGNRKTVYYAAAAPNGARETTTTVDVDHYTGTAIPKRVINEMRSEKEKLEAQERDRTAANPDGPFKGATSNVVASASVDPRLTGLLKDWMQHLGLGNVRVFLHVPTDITEANRAEQGIHGPFRKIMAVNPAEDDGEAGSFGPRNNDFYIALNQTGNERLDIDNLGHELGHIVKWTSLATATPEQKVAFEKDYQQFLMKTKGMTLADAVRASRGTAAGEAFSQQNPNVDETSPKAQAFRTYVESRDEWFADNVAKHLTTNENTVSLVGQFFARVGKLLSNLVRLMKTGFVGPENAPAESVKTFLDGMVGKGEQMTWNSMSKADAGDVNAFRTTRGLGPQSVNENSETLDKIATKVRDAAQVASNLSSKAQKVMLGWSTIGHIADFYKKIMPNVQNYETARGHAQTVATRVAQLYADIHSRENALPQAAQDRIAVLMDASTRAIDGRKSWTDHDHLHNEKDAVQLEKDVTAANAAWNEMGKMPGAQEAYQAMVANNETLRMAPASVDLFNTVSRDEQLKGAIPMSDPINEFLNNQKLHENAFLAQGYWQQTLDGQVQAVRDYIKAQKGAAAITTKASERASINTRISPLEQALLQIEKGQNVAAQSPYFHVGRTGDYFVAFDMKAGADGKTVDPTALKAVADHLSKTGFDNVVISQVNDKPGVYIRLETQSAGDNLLTQLKVLQAAGHVGENITKGEKSDPRVQTYMKTADLEKYIDGIKARFEAMKGDNDETNAQIEKTKMQMVSTAREQWLDMMSDNAIVKVQQQRNMVQGYNKDMRQNYAKRFQMGANALAHLSAQPRISDAMSGMNADVLAAQKDNSLSLKDVSLRRDILDEIMLREQQRSVNKANSWVDSVRAASHAYFLGFSPSYVFVNLTQPMTMLLPELGKKYGFVNSAKAMANVTPAALRIVGVLARSGKTFGDGAITEKVFDDAKVNAADRAFLTQLINRGVIDLGSAGREQGQVASGTEDTLLTRNLRRSSAFGLYSETFSRLIAGLAARDLHGEKPGAVDYAANTINQSMFNYSSWNTARQMGKSGFVGEYTPLSMNFLQYQAQLIEKLTREVHSGFMDKAASDTEKSEARAFLAQHTAMMTVFAGTLGLPAVTLMARAAEKLADLWKDDKDEPWDAKAAYRNGLASIFGKDAAEVIARGVPRALGFDISARAGEADIVPFTKLLADKRKWEDRVKDFATGTAGAPFSMVANLVTAGNEFAKGNVIEGLRAGAPAALRAPALAYDMYANGYHDKSGNALPITPGASDIITQLVGFQPQQKAEYNEASQTQNARKGEMQRRSAEIRKDLAVAMEKGDTDAQATLMERAKDFDRANPGFQILPRMQATLTLRAKARAMADVQNEPLGIKPKDRAGIGLTDFANY